MQRENARAPWRIDASPPPSPSPLPRACFSELMLVREILWRAGGFLKPSFPRRWIFAGTVDILPLMPLPGEIREKYIQTISRESREKLREVRKAGRRYLLEKLFTVLQAALNVESIIVCMRVYACEFID